MGILGLEKMERQLSFLSGTAEARLVLSYYISHVTFSKSNSLARLCVLTMNGGSLPFVCVCVCVGGD